MPLHQTRLTVRIPAQPHLRLDARGIHKILWPRFVGLDREHFWRVDLNARSGFLGAELLSIGTVDSALAHPREVFKNAFAVGASKIALAHNHPSGDLHPSPQDLQVFRRFLLCGDILGVEVVDQLIIHEGRCFSLRESGLGAPYVRGKGKPGAAWSRCTCGLLPLIAGPPKERRK